MARGSCEGVRYYLVYIQDRIDTQERGTGRTGRLATGIASRAIQNGFEARFTTAAQLIEELSNAVRTGRLTPRHARRLGSDRVDLLYQPRRGPRGTLAPADAPHYYAGIRLSDADLVA